MAFDLRLPGCFSESDLIFANHAADEERAFEWLVSLREGGIGWTEARRQISEYLQTRGASKAHIERQITRARSMMKPWLVH